MIMENYKHGLDNFFVDNITIINGDDLIMSSDYDDLDLNSRHATIEWAGKPISYDDADFCSLMFEPYIRHDAKKVRAVLDKRIPRKMMLLPNQQLQRLGGLLRVLVDKEMYDEILSKMKKLAKKYSLWPLYYDLFIDYQGIYDSYNQHYFLGA